MSHRSKSPTRPGRPGRLPATLIGAALAWLSLAGPAHALPSFARQTGEECAACHVGAFGPQLTPHGMRFKLEGYSDTDGKPGKVPLSAMVVGSFGHTAKDVDGENDKRAIQEASAFLAGRLADHMGAFVQATTASGEHGKFALDNVDLRYARPFTLADGDALVGFSLNNNPTVTDPFNTVPAWRFPYMSAEMVETAASPLLDGGLEMQVVGANAYALWDNSIYAEVGLYKSLSTSFLDSVNVEAGGKIDGAAPYWRLAYMKDNHKDAWSVGLLGMSADIQPDRLAGGPTDSYRDIGVDATYQYLGDRKNIFAVNAAYINEHQTRRATDADHRTGDLNRFDLSGSWHYDQTYGLTASVFDIQGDSDATLYADSARGSPDSRGYTLQADWTPWGKEGSWGSPWANLRLGLQYTSYSKFNGASKNYDGAGRDASDNNTLYAFVWTSF